VQGQRLRRQSDDFRLGEAVKLRSPGPAGTGRRCNGASTGAHVGPDDLE